MANIASFIILLVFLYGRSLAKKNLTLHIRLMCTAFAADLTLILALVFGRHALGKVDGDMPLELMIHVPIAVATVIAYGFTMFAGFQLYNGNSKARGRLIVWDKLLTTLRILTLLTSLWVQFGGE